MPAVSTPSRRVALLLILLFAFISIMYIAPINSRAIKNRTLAPITGTDTAQNAHVEQVVTKGHAIMPKLGNETAKYVFLARLRRSLLRML